jgi:PAS domain S-box-containing protein
MSQSKPTYEELEQRCLAAEARLAAIQGGQTGSAADGEPEALALRLAEAEEALRSNTERLSLALEAAQAGTWVWDLRTNQNDWSEELWQVYGLEPHSCEPSYDAWRQTIHPDDRAKTEQAVGEASRNETEINAEWRVRGTDGALRWLMSRGKPERDSSGKVVRYNGIVIDITARKQTEERLQANERLLKLFVEYAPAAMAMFDREMKYIAASRRYIRDYRLPTSEVIGRSHYEIFPEIPERWKEIHRRCLAGAVEKAEADPFPREDGSLDWVRWEIHPWYETPWKIGGILLFSEMITERKNAEEELRQSEERFHSVLDNMLEGAQILNFDWRYLYLNPAAEKHNRRPSQELLGNRYMDMWPGIEETYVFAVIKRCIEQREASQLENRFIYPDGIVGWFDLSIQPIPEGVFILSVDITERKQAEEALRESEERYRGLFEHMVEGYAYCQMLYEDGEASDWVYLAVNQAFETLTGLKGAAGKRVSELIPGIRQTDPQLFEIYSRAALTGQHEKFEIFVQALQMWFSVSVYSPKKDFFVAVFDVITERKQAEEKLRASEARYRLIADNTADVIWVMDPVAGKFTYVSPSVEKLRGYTPEEVMAQPANAALTPESLEQVSQSLAANLPAFIAQVRGTQSFVNLVDQPHKNGSIVHTEVITTYLFNERGEVEIVGVTRDITQRKRAEQALQESERRYRELVQNANSAILRWKGDGTITFFNEFAQAFFGYRPEQIIGENVGILVPETESTGGDLSGLVENIVAHPEQYTNFVNENICRDGHRVWVAWTNRPIFDEHGQVVEILAVGGDITERKMIENELRRSNAELEQFAYVASHDLQEPLRVVTGMVQLLEQRYKDRLDDRANEYIRYTVDAAGRMQALINDLLTYSRVGRRGNPPKPVSSQQALETALDNLQMTIRETGAIITYVELPTVRADQLQLTQLFQNLIGNALKFRGERTPEIQIKAKKLSDAWQFSVCDNGIGIEPQYFERIFLVFQRLHSRREYDGTGIGLALCKKIVERHDGRIWVESEPGLGSQFHFTLPIQE